MRTAVKDTADLLGNTLAVARSSYIDPRVIDAYDDGRTIDRERLDSAESQLRVPPHRLRARAAGFGQVAAPSEVSGNVCQPLQKPEKAFIRLYG